jgi:hypothetical protein
MDAITAFGRLRGTRRFPFNQSSAAFRLNL